MHICTAIETGDQHYNRSYGMSCLKYDNVMALYRIYIAFSYHQSTFFYPSAMSSRLIKSVIGFNRIMLSSLRLEVLYLLLL
jgi:hypothetical protein